MSETLIITDLFILLMGVIVGLVISHVQEYYERKALREGLQRETNINSLLSVLEDIFQPQDVLQKQIEELIQDKPTWVPLSDVIVIKSGALYNKKIAYKHNGIIEPVTITRVHWDERNDVTGELHGIRIEVRETRTIITPSSLYVYHTFISQIGYLKS